MSTNQFTKAKGVFGSIRVRKDAVVDGNLTVTGVLTGTTDPSVATLTTSGLATLNSEVVGGGTTIKQIKSFSFTITPTANTIAAGTVYETGNLTVTGAALGDNLVANPQALEAGLVWGVQVTGAGTAKVRISNPTLADITTAARTWTVVWTDLT